MSEEFEERLTASVSPELKRKVRVEAAKRDMTMSEFVREVLESKFGEPEESDESEEPGETGNSDLAVTPA